MGKIIVIGAGQGGLVAAKHLKIRARRGCV